MRSHLSTLIPRMIRAALRIAPHQNYMVCAVGIVVVTTLNGETNWFEGVQLLALYAMIAVAIYFLP